MEQTYSGPFPSIEEPGRVALLKSSWPIIFLLTVGLLSRLPHLGESLWYDEVWYATSYKAKSLADLWWFVVNLPPAPLYRVVMFVWINIFGEHELLLRLPSLVFGLLSVLVTYKIAQTFGSEFMALLAGLLLCLSPSHVWYSQEATPYIMALCFLLIAVYALLKLKTQQNHGVWYIIYIACLLIAVFTHYFTALFLLPLTTSAFWATPLLRNKLIIANFGVGLWLVVVMGIKSLTGHLESGMGFLRPFTLFEWWMLFFNWFLHGNSIWQFNLYGAKPDLLIGHPSLLLVQLVFLTILLYGLILSRRQRHWGQTLELSLYLSAIPVFLLVLTWIGYSHLYIERYVLFIGPFFMIVLARGITGFQNKKILTMLTLAVLIFAIVSYGTFLYKSDTWTVYKPNPDWRSAAAYLIAENPNSHFVIVSSSSPMDTLEYYLQYQNVFPQIIYYHPEQFDYLPTLGHQSFSFYLVKNNYWDVEKFEVLFQSLESDSRFRVDNTTFLKAIEIYKISYSG